MSNQRHILAVIVLATISLGIASAQTPKAISYTTKKDILYRSGTDLSDYMRERCRLDVYYPNTKDFSTVVWFHGGGLKAGSKKVPAGLEAKGLAIVAVNYRLNPKVKAPAYIEDAAAAVAWTFKNHRSPGWFKKTDLRLGPFGGRLPHKHGRPGQAVARQAPNRRE